MMGRVHRFLTDGEKSLCKMEQTSICWREAGDPANERGRGRAQRAGGKRLAGRRSFAAFSSGAASALSGIGMVEVMWHFCGGAPWRSARE
jgi:hypothetical protein